MAANAPAAFLTSYAEFELFKNECKNFAFNRRTRSPYDDTQSVRLA